MQSPSCPKSGNPKISGSYTQGVHPYTTNFVLCRKCSSPLSVTQHRYCCVGISSRPRQFILVAIFWHIQNQKCRINGPVRHCFNLLTIYHLKTESYLGFVNFRSILENCTEHINTFCGNIQIFFILQHVVYRITTLLRRDKRLGDWFVSRLTSRQGLLFQAKMPTILWTAVEHSYTGYIPTAFCAYLVDSVLRC